MSEKEIRSKYLYNEGDNVEKLEILQQIKIKKTSSKSRRGYILGKGYKYKCTVCGYIGEKHESDIKKGIGCSVCTGKVVVKDINSMWKTHNYMVEFLENESDGYINTYCSGNRVNVKCKDCGHIRKMRIRDLYSGGYSCVKCGDGVSMPDKFIHEILSQSNLEFDSEKSFKWSNGKIYDFYIPYIKCIIEVHGRQHYDGGFKTLCGNDLRCEQQNDEYKMSIALKNGIRKYIVIDCRKSGFEWLRDRVLDSKLSKIIDMDNINFVRCYELACSSKVKKVADLFNSGKTQTSVLAKTLKTSQQSIIKYLKQARSLGWCDYNEDVSAREGRNKGHEKRKRKVICLNNNFVENSIKEMIDRFKNELDISVTNCGISSTCSGRYSNHKGYRFAYYEDYINDMGGTNAQGDVYI